MKMTLRMNVEETFVSDYTVTKNANKVTKFKKKMFCVFKQLSLTNQYLSA